MTSAARLLDDGRTLVITRTLNAPRALVWKMFADPYHLAQWWGPKGFTNRVENSGLFWHFVDLVWIFLFPVLYLL